MQEIYDALNGVNGCSLELHQQPIKPIAGNGISTFELLLRLKVDSHIYCAKEFIHAIAASIPLQREIDEWVLNQAVSLLKEDSDNRYAINLCPSTLEQTAFHNRFAIKFRGLRAKERLIIELTERKPFSEEAANAIAHLQDCCLVVLDDLGSGHSALLHLKDLRVCGFKIDGRIVKDLVTSDRASAIIAGVLLIAQTLSMFVVAEFVESKEIWENLLKLRDEVAPKTDLWVQGWGVD